MKVTTDVLELSLLHPFKLAHGTSTHRYNVIVTLDDGTFEGIGEAAVVPYYGESPERIIAYIKQADVQAILNTFEGDVAEIMQQLHPTPAMPALAALDMALHDLWGKHANQPIYQLWGVTADSLPINSFTLALPTNDAAYRDLLKHHREHPLLKLKMGNPSLTDDLHLINMALEETETQLCIDANGGWGAENTQLVLQSLAGNPRIQFIEQPVAKDAWHEWEQLRHYRQQLGVSIPIIADESVQGIDSVAKIAPFVDGVNIKLAKCGGLVAARQMIEKAKAFGLLVMIGCMVETSVAITAAAQLAPLAQYLDLDGHLLITNNPFKGVTMQQGTITLPTQAGLGVTKQP